MITEWQHIHKSHAEFLVFHISDWVLIHLEATQYCWFSHDVTKIKFKLQTIDPTGILQS